METVTKGPEETRRLGGKIAVDLITNYELRITNYAIVLALSGELGSGKTTFIQGFASGLGVKQRIISPTFIIVRRYVISPITNHQSPITNFYHIDLYRLEQNVESEVKNLGIKDIWNNPENVVAIEWAEKIKKLLPKNTIWIKFENIDGEQRRVELL